MAPTSWANPMAHRPYLRRIKHLEDSRVPSEFKKHLACISMSICDNISHKIAIEDILLLKFRVKNFRSFSDEQEFHLAASRLSDPETASTLPVSSQGHRVLPVAAIYGPNASGKTNLLRALHFMCSAVEESHSDWRPDQPINRQPFLANRETQLAPSEFEALVQVGGNVYQYGFEVSRDCVLREWLFAFPDGHRQLWFERDRQAFKFGRKLTGEKSSIAALTRPNSLFLSAAAQNNQQQLSPLYAWFASVEFVRGERAFLTSRTASLFRDRSELRELITSFLKRADLGVADVSVEEGDVPGPLKQLSELIQSQPSEKRVPLSLPDRFMEVYLRHETSTGSFRLALEEESAGTGALFGLLGPIFESILGSRLVCVDELDASLHPLLARQLISLFCSASLRHSGAQMIFNTHDTNLLDRTVLRRDQIWFTEKDESGSTVLYPLTEFKPRKDENLQSGYLQGRYGAIPFLSWSDDLDPGK